MGEKRRKVWKGQECQAEEFTGGGEAQFSPISCSRFDSLFSGVSKLQTFLRREDVSPLPFCRPRTEVNLLRGLLLVVSLAS